VLIERLKEGQAKRPLIHDKTGKELRVAVERMMLTRAACYGSAHVVWKEVFDDSDAIDDALAGIRWRLEP
jgi:hypothetical protein